MKKWIRFKFKNLLWLYLVVLWVALAFFAFILLKDGETLVALATLLMGVIGSVGSFFGFFYGIRITDKNYLFICSQKIKIYKRESVKSITFYFIGKDDHRYDVIAKVFMQNSAPIDFVWTDLYTKNGGALNLDVKDSNLNKIIKDLKSDEKISVEIKNGY